jgi:hypothetical protein
VVCKIDIGWTFRERFASKIVPCDVDLGFDVPFQIGPLWIIAKAGWFLSLGLQKRRKTDLEDQLHLGHLLFSLEIS